MILNGDYIADSYCCLHIKPLFLPNDISSTPSVLPDSSLQGDTISVVTDSERKTKR